MSAPGDPIVYFSGIDPEAGAYATPSRTLPEMRSLILGEPEPQDLALIEARPKREGKKEQRQQVAADLAEVRTELRRKGLPAVERHKLQRQEGQLLDELQGLDDLALVEWVDPRDLKQAGWCVVFAQSVHASIREALHPLIAHRQREVGREAEYVCREYLPGEQLFDFLDRNGVHDPSAPVDPKELPYYVLLVGSPEEIPFEFQYSLDLQYAVGRLHFDSGAAADYDAYARSVVAVEEARARGETVLPGRVAFFAPTHGYDPPTEVAFRLLVKPLCDALSERAQRPDGWRIESYFQEAATRDTLLELLGGARTPALLFTSLHGVMFARPDHGAQAAQQGAHITSEWEGPSWPLRPEHYVSGDDIADTADLRGSVILSMACCGAGTPLWDSLSPPARRVRLAPRPMISALPQRLLGHPRGGALAFLGHVDRGLSYSFCFPGRSTESRGDGDEVRKSGLFHSLLERLLAAQPAPIGHAVDYLNQRHAVLATFLSNRREVARSGVLPDPGETDQSLLQLWCTQCDARSFVVLGDPAVRLHRSEGPVRTDALLAAGAVAPPDPLALPEALRAEISPFDWRRTPDSVRQALLRLLTEGRGAS